MYAGRKQSNDERSHVLKGLLYGFLSIPKFANLSMPERPLK